MIIFFRLTELHPYAVFHNRSGTANASVGVLSASATYSTAISIMDMPVPFR